MTSESSEEDKTPQTAQEGWPIGVAFRWAIADWPEQQGPLPAVWWGAAETACCPSH